MGKTKTMFLRCPFCKSTFKRRFSNGKLEGSTWCPDCRSYFARAEGVLSNDEALPLVLGSLRRVVKTHEEVLGPGNTKALLKTLFGLERR